MTDTTAVGVPGLDELLVRAVERHIFGTKMRSVIKQANPVGIKKIVDQQFEIGLRIAAAGLDRKSTRLNSSHIQKSRMPSSA